VFGCEKFLQLGDVKAKGVEVNELLKRDIELIEAAK
jgi:hypothetical protein